MPLLVVLLMEKEGLQTAIDFTKLLMALAGGGIALIIQPHFLDGWVWLKIVAITALLSLSACVVSGLFVVSGGAVRLAEKQYGLNFPYIKVPGRLSVLSFGLGFMLLSGIVGVKIIFPIESTTTPPAVCECPQTAPPPAPAAAISTSPTPKPAAPTNQH